MKTITISHNRVVLPDSSLGEELSPVIEIFGEWAVTVYGIEHVAGSYYIASDRLDEPDWIPHMKEKEWVNILDFESALSYAKKYFSKPERKKEGVSLAEYYRSKGFQVEDISVYNSEE